MIEVTEQQWEWALEKLKHSQLPCILLTNTPVGILGGAAIMEGDIRGFDEPFNILFHHEMFWVSLSSEGQAPVDHCFFSIEEAVDFVEKVYQKKGEPMMDITEQQWSMAVAQLRLSNLPCVLSTTGPTCILGGTAILPRDPENKGGDIQIFELPFSISMEKRVLKVVLPPMFHQDANYYFTSLSEAVQFVIGAMAKAPQVPASFEDWVKEASKEQPSLGPIGALFAKSIRDKKSQNKEAPEVKQEGYVENTRYFTDLYSKTIQKEWLETWKGPRLQPPIMLNSQNPVLVAEIVSLEPLNILGGTRRSQDGPNVSYERPFQLTKGRDRYRECYLVAIETHKNTRSFKTVEEALGYILVVYGRRETDGPR